MSRWSRVLDLIAGWSPATGEPPSRDERREAARRRHHESGEPLWAPEDQLLGPTNKREVADVAPGLPGHGASVRTIQDD